MYTLLIQHFDPRSQRTSFAALEIHVVPKRSGDNESVAMYRVFSHTGQLEKKDTMVYILAGFVHGCLKIFL